MTTEVCLQYGLPGIGEDEIQQVSPPPKAKVKKRAEPKKDARQLSFPGLEK